MSGGGALDSSVTLDEVFTVVGERRVPLAPELAGYLVLEIAEHADPDGGDVDPKSVYVSEEGTVALVKPRRDVRESGGGHGDHAERSIREMLVRLLEASGSQTAALAATAKRRNLAGLPALAEELATALIPVNRAAGRRALARLAREVRRVTLGVGRNALPSSNDGIPASRRASYASHPGHGPMRNESQSPPSASRPSASSFSREEDPTTARGQIPDELLRKASPAAPNEAPTMEFEPASREPSPSQADVDSLISDFGVSGQGDHEHARDLKALAGVEPTPHPELSLRARGAPSGGATGGARPPTDGGVESLLAMTPREGAEKPMLDATRATANAGGERSQPAVAASMAPTPMLGFRRAREDAQLPTQPSQLKRSRGPLAIAPRGSGRGSWPWIVAAVGALAVGGAAVWRLRPAEPDRKTLSHAAPSASPSAPARIAPACRATLVVTDVPPRAEVLLHEGQAPVDVEKMPVGARLEFVATAEGFAPKRVVVPTGATWDTAADGKPRFEAAVQLDKSTAKAGANDPWPPAEPGTDVGGQGPPGTVHVVATPRGAEVWMLAGMGPEARVEQLRCDRDIEVLVAGPGPLRKRLHAASADFAVDANPSPGVPVGATAMAAGQTKPLTRMARLSAK